ncbi:hypothetical protein GH714_036214 [Hevea brasiliensis]|uniref:DUF1664 domain-containing protein n=1 Tax=Hevea brasiliensis TaxID=3981 RepID=A0A6A6LLV2_HEVBR|nr:hypothetical protein GH714_036214 [Hevea brasiliensis]
MTCRQCLGDCVIWEESIDEQPWEKARSISPLKVKDDDEVDNLEIKLEMKKKSKRVYQSPPPEVGQKISRSLKSLNAKTGLFSKRMKIIHRNPKLHAQRVAAIKKAKGTAAARKHTSETLKAFFSDPENRRKRSIAMKGYTGTILFKNGKLSDLIGELQSLVKGLEKSGERADGDSDYSDALAQQVKRLAMDVRQLGSARQITVLNGSSGQIGNLTSLIVPATALGHWVMVTCGGSMANAVSNLTKHLEQVTEALSAAKVHLTQRIQLLDDKMESQKEISKAIQNDVNAASENISQIGSELWQLQCLVSGLDGKIGSLEEKQDLANMGVLYLCNFVGGNKMKMPKALEDQLKPSGRTRSITYAEASLSGLKELADNLYQTMREPTADVIVQDGIDNLEGPPHTPQSDQPRTLLRSSS